MYMTTSTIATSTSMNGISGPGMVDDSGTINPAALNSSGTSLPVSSLHAQQNVRGQKRSRSPDYDGGSGAGDLEDQQKSKKRGRPLGGDALNGTSYSTVTPKPYVPESVQTPPQPPTILPQDSNTSPNHASPAKATPTKPPVIKALPTVRDHTTDQLTPEQDEYIPREFDPEGEKKATPTGQLLAGREYRMRTFYVNNRGEKLFMLATECARVLGYRDSYLLFNKNRSLHKIIATQAEKDELIQHDILPYSYRSRQIAIVTAKSMFRQFGSRVIVDGRRVRDDYWEAKARKQGFTEEDLAGDKRPGTGKARDAAALEAASNDQPGGVANQDVSYRDVPLPAELGGTLPPANHNIPIPMIQTDKREYGKVPRQKQDISGIPYQDKTQAGLATDIMHQASHAAEMNKNITQQRNYRAQSYQESWNKKIDQPLPTNPQKTDQSPTMNQPCHPAADSAANISHQHPSLHHQSSSQTMSPQSYRHPSHSQNPHIQSPRSVMPTSMRPDIHHPGRPSVYTPGPHGGPQPAHYGTYPHSNAQMWGQPPSNPSPHGQPHQSPVISHHSSLSQHYSPSPQQQPVQHPSQSPHHRPQHSLPQLPHGGPQGNFYGNMAGMQAGATMYGGMGQQRSMYHQQSGGVHAGSPNPQQQAYMQQTASAQQAGMQGFAPPSSGQSWGGFPASTGY